MRHDDRMNETEGKALAQGMNVLGETETREEAKGQNAAEPEAPQEKGRPRKRRRRTRPLTGSWRR